MYWEKIGAPNMRQVQRLQNFTPCIILFTILVVQFYDDLATSVMGSPSSSLDKFVSPCTVVQEPVLIDNGTGNYEACSRWSSPSTWENNVIPGLGNQTGVNVTIPCGKLILLDVPLVVLGLLKVQGLLRVVDDPSVRDIRVFANYILVEGQLYVGTASTHFRQRVTFILTPNIAGGRAHLQFTSFPPADERNPRSLGHKAFAVVGGQVQFYGVPGGLSTPSWTKLIKTANVGDNTITVSNTLVSHWPVGYQILVTSTDYDRNQAETFTIQEVRRVSNETVMTLNKPFKFMHFGDPLGLSDGFGGFVDECAEVALLTRNIEIRGSQEDAPYDLEGGHFIVFQTPVIQNIEGVEFVNMGQQGNLGRYPLHFHVLGSVPNNTCRKNTVHNSLQRCIVLHATNDMTVEGNVAYNTKGHCFMTEEGGEMGNKFKENLGAVTEPVSVRISSEESDHKPSTFWISNAQNRYTGNVAAGSQDSGFWFELRHNLRGISLTIPNISQVHPINQPILEFSNNVGHSNIQAGLRTYPNGIHVVNNDKTPADAGVLSGVLLYKNSLHGALIHFTDRLTINKSTVADNGFGIFIRRAVGCVLSNSRIIGATTNYGNPSDCTRRQSSYLNCRPITGCSMPLASNSLGRSTGGVRHLDPTFGVLLDSFNKTDENPLGNRLEGTLFSKFDGACRRSVAISLVSGFNYWCAAHSVKKLKFDRTTQRLWVPPQFYNYRPFKFITDGGEQSQFLTLMERDGSLSGRGGSNSGYFVANNSAILPPFVQGSNGCKFISQWNAFSCPGTCYRTVGVTYGEPGWKSWNKNAGNKHGDFSYLRVTRSDGKLLTLDGNLNDQNEEGGDQRFFSMTLLSNMTYTIEIMSAKATPRFYPSNISIRFLDIGGCLGGLNLHIKPALGFFLSGIEKSTNFVYKPCPGASVSSSNTAELRLVCSRGMFSLGEVVMKPLFVDTAVIFSQPGDSPACASPPCSLLPSAATDWLYDASGKDFPMFYNPGINTASWLKGVAPLGFSKSSKAVINTVLPRTSKSLVRYLFRRSFTLKDGKCFNSLQLEITAKRSGAVVYLNSVEVCRISMPAGFPVSNFTLATPPTQTDSESPWVNCTVELSSENIGPQLVEGINVISVEQHAASYSPKELIFDFLLTGFKREGGCTGPAIRAEVCDGIDNDNDGTVDRNGNGSILSQACRSQCGTGKALCLQGSYQNCSARMPARERCNGLDDDCDGLIDNGFGSLDCENGDVCFQGKCVPLLTNGTVEILPRMTSGWLYHDKQRNVSLPVPAISDGQNYWVTPGYNTSDLWKAGVSPLGFGSTRNFPVNTQLDIGPNPSNAAHTYYFLKYLTVPSISCYFQARINLLCRDGAVIYFNGVEAYRYNMPNGTVGFDTFATSLGSKTFIATTLSGGWLKRGRNVIAVELHLRKYNNATLIFDMQIEGLTNNLGTC